MGKKFIEYHSENGRIPYSASTLCFCLTQYVRNYISSNRENIANIDKDVRDAVLVDAINYLGTFGGCDFALYTKDLYSGRVDDEEVDAQCLLTTIQNFYATYIFQHGIVESVLRNNHMNNCKEEFDANDGAIVILDFINYVSQVNGYDKKFRFMDLYEKFKIQDHNAQMNRLKDFLEKTSKYSEMLATGETIDSIFRNMAIAHNLKNISEDGTYHYTDVISDRVGQSEMFSWDKKEVEEEIYAMAYAYGKMYSESKEQPKTEVINQKLLEMKKR